MTASPFFSVVTHWDPMGRPSGISAIWPSDYDKIPSVRITSNRWENLCLGSGEAGMPSHLCVDRLPWVKPDVVMDIDPETAHGGLPFRDDSFFHVFSHMVLEHIRNLLGLAEEIWRVCRHGAVVDFVLPWWTSHRTWGDPTHVRAFAPQSFSFWTTSAYEVAAQGKTPMGQYRPRCDFEFVHHFLVLNPRLKSYAPERLETAPALELNAVEQYNVRLRAVKRN